MSRLIFKTHFIGFTFESTQSTQHIWFILSINNRFCFIHIVRSEK